MARRGQRGEREAIRRGDADQRRAAQGEAADGVGYVVGVGGRDPALLLGEEGLVEEADFALGEPFDRYEHRHSRQ